MRRVEGVSRVECRVPVRSALDERASTALCYIMRWTANQAAQVSSPMPVLDLRCDLAEDGKGGLAHNASHR